jgi:tRNA G10  N-methylase Trm11
MANKKPEMDWQFFKQLAEIKKPSVWNTVKNSLSNQSRYYRAYDDFILHSVRKELKNAFIFNINSIKLSLRYDDIIIISKENYEIYEIVSTIFQRMNTINSRELIGKFLCEQKVEFNTIKQCIVADEDTQKVLKKLEGQCYFRHFVAKYPEFKTAMIGRLV